MCFTWANCIILLVKIPNMTEVNINLSEFCVDNTITSLNCTFEPYVNPLRYKFQQRILTHCIYLDVAYRIYQWYNGNNTIYEFSGQKALLSIYINYLTHYMSLHNIQGAP